MLSLWDARQPKGLLADTQRRASNATLPCVSIPRGCSGRAAPGVAWRRQHLGQDDGHEISSATSWDVLCVKGSGWDMAVIEPQGLPAVDSAPLLKAAQPGRAFGRRHGRAPARQPHRPCVAQPFGRDAAARLPAAQIRRPYAFDRDSRASSISPTAHELTRRYSAGVGLRALHHAGLRSRQACGPGVRGRPVRRRTDPRQAWHLHFWRNGAAVL